MPVTSKVLFRGAATTTTTTALYTVPTGKQAIVTNIVVSNATSSERTFTLSLDGIAINTAAPLAGNSTAYIDLKQVLDAGDAVTGGASGTGLTFHISGVEIA
jgi:hypothetical protein